MYGCLTYKLWSCLYCRRGFLSLTMCITTGPYLSRTIGRTECLSIHSRTARAAIALDDLSARPHVCAWLYPCLCCAWRYSYNLRELSLGISGTLAPTGRSAPRPLRLAPRRHSEVVHFLLA